MVSSAKGRGSLEKEVIASDAPYLDWGGEGQRIGGQNHQKNRKWLYERNSVWSTHGERPYNLAGRTQL